MSRHSSDSSFATTVALGMAFAAIVGWKLMPMARQASLSALSPHSDAAPEADAYYRNCAAARAAGAAPLRRGSPGYRAGLDRDNDGVACEPYRRW